MLSFDRAHLVFSGARVSLRSLVRDRATTAIAVLTLGLAIGSATAVVSLVDAVLLQPMPFADPERVYRIASINPEVSDGDDGVSYPDLLDLEATGTAFSALAGFYPYSGVMTGEDVPHQLAIAYTSLNFFGALRVEPVIGRPYTVDAETGLAPADTVLNADSVAVLGETFWRRVFGADPGIVGRSIVVDGTARRVLGIVPARLALLTGDIDVWLPWDMGQQGRNDRFLRVVGRLRPDAEPAAALDELRAGASELAARFPDTNEGWSVTARPLEDALLADLRSPMWILSAAAFLVLIVAAANVAGLLLARNWRRTREIAVRRALGASRTTIAARLAAESTILALLATAFGLGLGYALVRVLPSAGAGLPPDAELAAGPGVLAVASGLALLAGLFAGLTPALQAARQDPVAGLNEGGRASSGRAQLRLRAGLIAAETAIVTVLLVAMGLLLTSFVRLAGVSHGFETANLVVGRIELEPGRAASASTRVEFFDNLLADLRARPEVVAAGATTVLPMATSGTDFNRRYWRDGEPVPGGTAPEADIRMISSGYFRALGIPLLSGRDFGPEDRFDTASFGAGDRVIIVNRSLAERTWPGQQAVGQRLVMDYPRDVYVYEVVGVAGDARYYGPRNQPRPEIYIPYAQNPYPGMSVAVRVRSSTQAMIDAFPGIVADLNPAQPVSGIASVQTLVAGSVSRERLLLVLISAFGTLATLVALGGVYGLVASSVASRRRELGIRLAVGARNRDLVRQILGEVLLLASAGVGAGIAMALSLAGLLGDALYETSPMHPPVLVGVSALLLAVVTLAAAVPALRVTRIDPLTAIGRG